MASMKFTATVDKDIEAELRRIDVTVRAVALDKALKKIGNKVKSKAKRLVPQPGSPDYTPRRGERKTRKHMKDTISVRVRDYRDKIKFMVVGPAYPAGAAGHLVEFGHEMKESGVGRHEAHGLHFKKGQFKERTVKETARIKLAIKQKTLATIGNRTRPKEFIGPASAEVEPQVQEMLLEELRKVAT